MENPEVKDKIEELPSSLEDIFDPTIRWIIEGIAGETGFNLRPYPGYPNPPKIGIGWFTITGTRTIYYNPHHVHERGPTYSLPIFLHEIRHHDKDLEAFQDSCDAVGNIASFLSILPVKKIIKVMNNISADIYLEEKNATGPYAGFMRDLYRRALAQDVLPDEAFEEYQKDLDPDNFPWTELERSEQKYLFQDFINFVLLMPKFGIPPQDLFKKDDIESDDSIDARVYDALIKAEKFIDIIKNCNQEQISLTQKVYAQLQLFNLAKELLDIDYQNMEGQSSKTEQGEGEGEGEGEGKEKSLSELLKDFEEFLDDVLNGLVTISDEEVDPDKLIALGLGGNGEGKEANEGGDDAGSKINELMDELGNLIKSALSGIGKGLSMKNAKQLGVPSAELLNYLNYISQNSAFIQKLTDIFVELILKDRMIMESPYQRDGIMVQPGMETVTYFSYLGGDLEPATMIDHVEQVCPLSLEAAISVDTSGSMRSFNKGMLNLLAILIESIRQVHYLVTTNPQKYNWKQGMKMPARLELSTVADDVELVLPFSATLNQTMAVKKFNEMQRRGGGTNLTKALEFEYSRLTSSRDDQIVRILTLITDGQDWGEPLDRIVKKIINDPRIYFLVVGIGPNRQIRDSIVHNFKKHLTPQSSYRFFAHGFPKVDNAIIPILNFFRMALKQQRDKRDRMVKGILSAG
ncbi:vWA domain-containing protein [Patescibacteria group bacterium]